MITSKVTYSGQLRTSAEHIRSGSIVITDAPVDNNGKGQAFSPTDTVATGLASCMMTMMGIRAEKENRDLTGMTAEVTNIMAADPRRINKIIIKLDIPAKDLKEKDFRVLEKIACTCPVAYSLHPDIEQDLTFSFYD